MDESEALDLTQMTSVHIIGIGGAGMAAIAEVLQEMGHRVTGSDLTHSTVIDRLRAIGIDARVGHDCENVGDAEVVARSTAIPDGNPEVVEVVERGGAVLARHEILAAISALRTTVAVAGTHGKTTTSSMLAVIATGCDVDLSYIVGGDVAGLDSGAGWGDSPWFVVEADESDGTFLELDHSIGVVTNVEPDHLEHYGGEAALRRAFERFATEADVTIVCADDAGSMALTGPARTITYGEHASADLRIVELDRSAMATEFDVEAGGARLGRLRVPMPGLHNARNGLAAVAAAMEMGLAFDDAAAALAAFGGVGRRFQRRGEIGGITLIDDYAHLPTEVAAALDAATDVGAARIVAVFQPHRYSRTEALWSEFTGAFDDADLLIVTDVYSSGEKPRPGVTGRLIVDAVAAEPEHPELVYSPDRVMLAETVAAHLRPGDLCLTLGAGDLVTLPDELLDFLADPE